MDDNARVCINFQQGYCAKGDQCPLKHVKKELKSKNGQMNLILLRLEYALSNFWSRKVFGGILPSRIAIAISGQIRSKILDQKYICKSYPKEDIELFRTFSLNKNWSAGYLVQGSARTFSSGSTYHWFNSS